MLAKRYRLAIHNQSGGAITVGSCTITPWKWGSDGAVEHQTQQSQAWASVPDGQYTGADASIDNSTVLAVGGKGRINITAAGSAESTVYLQESEDGSDVNWANVFSQPLVTLVGTGIAEFTIGARQN